MLKNYFKIAFRNLWKRKGYSLINVTGLSIGIAAALLISLYAINELSYDTFHQNSDDLYLVYKERVTPAGIQEAYDTWVPMKMELEESYPNVVRATREFTESVWIEAEGKRFQENVSYIDSQMFEMFTFPLSIGDNLNPFPSLQSIVISKTIAQKYFGNEDPMGKILRLGYERDYVVSGVLEEIPQNSTIQMDMAIQLESAGSYENIKENWGSSFLNTYVQLRKGASPSELEAQFPAFIANIWDQETAERTNFKLLPVPEMYNRFNDSDKYAYILLAIAIAIVVIACINFMNMATARSMERAREVGMRKTLGGRKSQLIMQFLGESMLITILALLAGFALGEALLPAFNKLYDLDLSLSLFENIWLLSGLAGFGVLIGLIAGSYPALFLSKFSPVEVLRGQISKKPGGLSLRRVLVVTQFAVTIIIIIGTLVMKQQVEFMRNAELGLQVDNIIAIQGSADDFGDEEDANIRLSTYKNEILKHPNVVSVASSRSLPGQLLGFNSFTFVQPEGWAADDPLRMRWTLVDHDFFNLFEINLLEGRHFRAGSETDRNEGVIINKAALDDFGWETAVGKTIHLGGDEALNVVGVVDNYHYQSLENEVEPVLHFYRPPENTAHGFISVKLGSGDLSTTLREIESKWTEIVAADMPLNYSFVDDQFDQLYQIQDRLVTVSGFFSLFAIMIASLGLFALASLMVSQRTKEIGIRKVLGATVAKIMLMVSKDFVLMVLAGFFIAVPIAWYLMTNWLREFAYRINPGIEIFLAGGLCALIVAIVTVSVHAIKAAKMNPVESLRSE
ncbi:MAG: ABC transporter permease [Candidatus Paceibacterota bacterium]